ncbi:hypothetical protein KAU19_06555 [Candidatus Parcubacteria bacterium]|nr:hypothetical protein [Candidatus Parcubacteria bacterium]
MIATMQVLNQKGGRHQREWNEAQRAAEIYFKKNPNNFFRLIEEIVDKIFLDREIKVEASYGKVTKAVVNKRKDLLGELCDKAAKIYFDANPRDLSRRPAWIAGSINEVRENALPFGMLTAIVGKQQKVLCEKGRQRSVAIAGSF